MGGPQVVANAGAKKASPRTTTKDAPSPPMVNAKGAKKFQVYLGQGWKDMSDEENKVLCQAFSSGVKKATFRLRGKKYDYDFVNMVQMNVDSQKSRPIRPPPSLVRPKTAAVKEGRTMMVQVPAGATPGATIAVPHPDVNTLNLQIKVPANAGPGTQLMVPVPDPANYQKQQEKNLLKAEEKAAADELAKLAAAKKQAEAEIQKLMEAKQGLPQQAALPSEDAELAALLREEQARRGRQEAQKQALTVSKKMRSAFEAEVAQKQAKERVLLQEQQKLEREERETRLEAEITEIRRVQAIEEAKKRAEEEMERKIAREMEIERRVREQMEREEQAAKAAEEKKKLLMAKLAMQMDAPAPAAPAAPEVSELERQLLAKQQEVALLKEKEKLQEERAKLNAEAAKVHEEKQRVLQKETEAKEAQRKAEMAKKQASKERASIERALTHAEKEAERKAAEEQERLAAEEAAKKPSKAGTAVKAVGALGVAGYAGVHLADDIAPGTMGDLEAVAVDAGLSIEEFANMIGEETGPALEDAGAFVVDLFN